MIRPALGPNNVCIYEPDTSCGNYAKELIAKEVTTTTKKNRRIAEFSWSLFRKACELNSPTDIALTFTDYISTENEKARRYDQLTPETRASFNFFNALPGFGRKLEMKDEH